MSISGPEERVSVDLGTGGRRASLPRGWLHGSAEGGQARGWADHDPQQLSPHLPRTHCSLEALRSCGQPRWPLSLL